MNLRSLFNKSLFSNAKIKSLLTQQVTESMHITKKRFSTNINFEWLSRTIESVSSIDRLNKKIQNNEKLIIKYGVDITAPFLHLGHAVNLWMLRHFQDCGHKVIFLLGDFTTKIADPTGRLATRKEIPQADIDRNADHFIRQVGKILKITDPSLFEVHRNSEWYSKMQLNEFLELLKLINYNRLIKRDMFQKRIQDEHEIHMHELIYPILQGYDSVMLKSDLTVVGSDQFYNETMGSFLQEKLGHSPQIVITTKITPGIDGKEKQSKSLGNYIGLEDTSRDMFGKVMSIPDNLIISYLKVYTDVELRIIAKFEEEMNSQTCNPMHVKKILAAAIVAKYYNMQVAEEESLWFERTFSRRIIPTNIPAVKIDSVKRGFDVLRGCLPNKSNAAYRRLLEQGGIFLQSKKVSNEKDLATFENNDILLIGKKRWFKLTR